MKKLLALMLTVVMVLSMCVVGAMAEELAPLTIDVYDEAANNAGVMTGWFAKVVKDRFNIEFNIIAPQVQGQELYAIRTADGNLGDLLIMDKEDIPSLMSTGLIRDISDITKSENLMKFKPQLDSYNKSLGLADGVYFGIPTEMTDSSPMSLTAELVNSQPQIRWDLYKAAGAPELKDINDLLDVLVKIHELHPTNDIGDPAYPISLWPDWDNNDNMSGPANVVQLTTWYGEKLKNSAMLKPDFTFGKITDREISYYKIVKFINKAYQLGIVDPESFEQDWNAVCSKISAGQIDLIWYNWEIGFWNSQERLDNGSAFLFIPVGDMNFYSDSDSYFGSARVWAIGGQVEGEKYDRLISFLDWYAGPEACVFQHVGIEGLTYTVGEDGKYIPFHDNALMDNLPVPEEFGGGGYQDGFNALNQWICASICMNPLTGETYDMKFWNSYIEKNMTQMKAEWTAQFGAGNAVEWMAANGKLNVNPSVPFSPAEDDNDIGLLRSDINQSLCKYTWKMFAAASDEAFEALWDEMVEELNGLGYEQLFEYDCAKWQPEVDMKIEAISNFNAQ